MPEPDDPTAFETWAFLFAPALIPVCIIESRPASLELRLVMMAVGVAALLTSLTHCLHATTRLHINIDRALFSSSFAFLMASCKTLAVSDSSDPESFEAWLHLLLFYVVGLTTLLSLNLYHGHGIWLGVDFIEKSPLRGHKLFIFLLALYLVTRLLTTLVSYVVYKRNGALDSVVGRAWFLRRAARPLVPLLYLVAAYMFFGAMPGMTAERAGKAVTRWFCSANATAES